MFKLVKVSNSGEKEEYRMQITSSSHSIKEPVFIKPSKEDINLLNNYLLHVATLYTNNLNANRNVIKQEIMKSQEIFEVKSIASALKAPLDYLLLNYNQLSKEKFSVGNSAGCREPNIRYFLSNGQVLQIQRISLFEYQYNISKIHIHQYARGQATAYQYIQKVMDNIEFDFKAIVPLEAMKELSNAIAIEKSRIEEMEKTEEAIREAESLTWASSASGSGVDPGVNITNIVAENNTLISFGNIMEAGPSPVHRQRSEAKTESAKKSYILK